MDFRPTQNGQKLFLDCFSKAGICNKLFQKR